MKSKGYDDPETTQVDHVATEAGRGPNQATTEAIPEGRVSKKKMHNEISDVCE